MDIFATTITAAEKAKEVVEYAIDVYKAPDDMKELLQQVNVSLSVLRQVKDLYQDVLKTSEPKNGLQEFYDLMLKNVEKYGEISREIKKYIAEHGEAWDRTLRRFTWPKAQKRIRAQIDEVSKFDGSFQMILSVMLAKSSQDMDDVLQKSVQDLKDTVTLYQGQAKYQSYIDRIPAGPFDFETRRQEHRRKSNDSPPSWIFGNQAYENWASSKEPKSRWLWGIGEAGTGKSCIASFLADELQAPPPSYDVATLSIKDTQKRTGKSTSISTDAKSAHPDRGVALFYCSYRSKQDQQDPDSIYKSLCRQLLLQLRELNPRMAWKRIPLVEEVMAEARAYDQRKADWSTLLQALCSDFSQPYIVIDALDENVQQYGDLVLRLDSLKSPNLRFFVTSRGGDTSKGGDSSFLRREAEQFGAFILDANQNDEVIWQYVAARLSHIAAKDRYEWVAASALPEAVRDPKNREAMVKKIVSAAGHNFLCAELHLNSLKHAHDLENLNHLLEKMSDNSSMDQLLAEAMERVKTLHSGQDVEIGTKTLRWAILASRTLTVPEIQNALAFNPRQGAESLQNSASKFSLQRIIESTGYFLNIDRETNTIQVHKAIQDYCDDPENQRRHLKDPQSNVDPHTQIAKACLQYLDPKIHRVHCTTKGEWQTRKETFPLLEYAAQNWGWHMEKGEETLLRPGASGDRHSLSILKLLRESRFLDNVALAMQPTLMDLGMWDESSWDVLRGKAGPLLPAIQILTYFNLQDTADQWLSEIDGNVDSPSKTSNPSRPGFSALYIACRMNRPNMVDILLDHGADPSRENGDKRFNLAAAAYRGHTAVVERLLDHDSAPELVASNNWYGRSPLADAASQGHLDVVRTILQQMSSMPHKIELVLHQDHNGYGAIHEAAANDHNDIIKLLGEAAGSEHRPELLSRKTKKWQDSPLHTASHGRTKALKALLELGSDTSARQSQGKTPLHLALQQGERTSDVVGILLKKTDLSLRDNDGRTLLHVTADHGTPGHIRTLLKYVPKEQLTVKNNAGMIPLIAAVRSRPRNWERCVIELLQASAESILDIDANEIFNVALETKTAEVLGKLYECTKDSQELFKGVDKSVLHRAVITHSLPMVQTTYEHLGNSIALEERNQFGQTPLVNAAGRQQFDIVKYLLSVGADINSQGGAGRTALHWAVEANNDRLADLLLENGVKTDITDNKGIQGLDLASARNKCRKLARAQAARPGLDSKDIREKECVRSVQSQWQIVTGVEQTKQEYIRLGNPADRVILRQSQYLLSDPIPHDAKFPISRVEVTIEAQDQGFSDHLNGHPQDRGSYIWSHTWFDLALVRGDRTILQYEWSRNKTGLDDPHRYHCSWRLETGHDDSGTSKWRRPVDLDEAKRLVRDLRAGDRVAVVAKAQNWLAWANLVRRAEVSILYED